MWQAAVERPGAAVVGASRLRQTVEAKGGWSTARYALRSRHPDQQGRRQGRPSPARDRGNPGQVISATNPTTTKPRSSGLRSFLLFFRAESQAHSTTVTDLALSLPTARTKSDASKVTSAKCSSPQASPTVLKQPSKSPLTARRCPIS